MDSKLNIKDFDNFFLYVDDLKKAKEYYENKLGLKVKFDFSEMGMVAFNVGNNEPAIILKDKKKYPDSKSVIWFVVDDVLKEYEKMSIENIKFLSEPFSIRTGNAVEFEDPFGNRFGITDYKK